VCTVACESFLRTVWTQIEGPGRINLAWNYTLYPETQRHLIHALSSGNGEGGDKALDDRPEAAASGDLKDSEVRC